MRGVRDDDGEPWVFLIDVCRIVGIKNSRDAAARLDEDEKGVVTTDTLGGPQVFAIVNESGLYSLILTSRKPEAKRFKKWVTAEVLPSIRKTGSYNAVDPMALLQDPAAMRTLLLSYSEKVIALQSERDALKPKAEVAERIAEADGLFCIRDTAKMLQLRERDFIARAISMKWIYRSQDGGRLRLYARREEQGYLTAKVYTKETAGGPDKNYPQVMFTGKGLVHFAHLIGKDISQPLQLPPPDLFR